MLNNGNGFCTICQSEIVDYEIPSACTGECGMCGVEVEAVPDYAIPAEVELDFNKDHVVPIPQPVDYDLDLCEDNPCLLYEDEYNDDWLPEDILKYATEEWDVSDIIDYDDDDLA